MEEDSFSMQDIDPGLRRLILEMSDNVKALTENVSNLKKELVDRPTREEYNNLLKTVEILKGISNNGNEGVQNELEDTKNEINKMLIEFRKNLKNEMDDTILSVNKVVRAQNTLIENKVLEMTKPSFEFNEMRVAVNNVKTQNEEIRQNLVQHQTFLESMSGEKIEHSGEPKRTLQKVMEDFSENDRQRISQLELDSIKLGTRIEKLESSLYKVIELGKMELPEYVSAPKQSITKKPKLPKLLHPKTFADYFVYIMEVVPLIQKYLSCYQKEIVLIGQCARDTEDSMSRKAEFNEAAFSDYVKQEELDRVKEVVADMKTHVATKNDLKVLERDIRQVREQCIDKEEFDSAVNMLQSSVGRIEQSSTLELKKLHLSMIEAKKQIPTTPAYTEVKPRGSQSFRTIYNDSSDLKTSARSIESVPTSRSVVRRDLNSQGSQRPLPPVANGAPRLALTGRGK